MQFDDILVNYLGSFGKYQKRVYFLVCLPAAYCAFSLFCWTFTGADIPHRCKLALNDTDFQDPKWYQLNQSILVAVEADSTRSCSVGGSCSDHGYVWDNSEISSSAAQDWELVCNRKWLKALVQSLFYIGQLVGCALFGFLSDRYGRKIVLLICTLAISVVSLLSAFSPCVELFAVYRFLQGALEPGVFQVPFVIGIELVGPSKRLSAGLLIQAFFTMGLIGLGGMAYFIRDWKVLQVAISLPGFLFFTYYWLMPESARWLLAVGRKEESVAILREAARVNGVGLPEEALDSLEDRNRDDMVCDQEVSTKGSQYSYMDLVRTPNLRRKTFIASYCWIVVTLVYYGISLNPSAIAGDFYSSFILASIMELPALLVLLLFLDLVGRRILQCGSFVFAGAAVIAVILVPPDMEVASVVLMLIGKLAITSAFCIVYIYTSEIFPTVVRSIGLGTAATCGRIGGIVSPFASLYLSDSNRMVLLVVLGTSSIVAGLLTFFLPETMNRQLPETLQDGEEFGNRNLSVLGSPSPKQKGSVLHMGDSNGNIQKELQQLTETDIL